MVLADGCFDPIHHGHIRYLVEAAKIGKPLVVRIAPDADIVAKGRKPYQTQGERMRTVLSIGVVDCVREHPTLEAAIRDLRPRYLVKGIEWKDHLPDSVQQACQESGTQIVYVATREKSSSERLSA